MGKSIWLAVENMHLFEADIIKHTFFFSGLSLEFFSITLYHLPHLFLMTRAHITFNFILPGVQDIGLGRISTLWSLLTMEIKNGIHFCVENKETEFPGLISPEFEFLWMTDSINTPWRVQPPSASLTFQTDVRLKWNLGRQSSLEIKAMYDW